MKYEVKLDIRNKLEKRCPRLRSFLRSSKSVVECALTAFLKLVSRDGSGKTTSLWEEFDILLEQEGLSKSLSLYKERRWAALGYQCGTVFDCVPLFSRLLNETPKSNLLIESCLLYLENEFILTVFKMLSWFTYKVTMPYINCVNMSTQSELLEILPILVSDLYEGKLDTLDKFSVKWTHVNVIYHEPDTELENYMIKDFIVAVADGIKLQCSREYWDEEEICEPRATQLHKLPRTSISNIAKDNTKAERTLARFGYLASISARTSNKKFTAKRIQDDIR